MPKGSILGPILFIIYINDLCNVSNLLKFVLFADDTNLFASEKDVSKRCDSINIELNKSNIWFSVNKLSLNISKIKFILFNNIKEKNTTLNINIDDKPIERVNETKSIGVIIDSNLSWKQYIAHVRSKLSKCISIIYKASQILDSNALRLLYCSLCLPYPSYCCEV